MVSMSIASDAGGWWEGGLEAAANVLCPAMVVYISRIFSVLAVYSLQENSRQFKESRVAKHGENALCRFAKTRIPEAQLKEEVISLENNLNILRPRSCAPRKRVHSHNEKVSGVVWSGYIKIARIGMQSRHKAKLQIKWVLHYSAAFNREIVRSTW